MEKGTLGTITVTIRQLDWTKVLIVALLTTGFATSTGAAGDRWEELKTIYFEGRDISAGEDVVTMEAPERAHDAATVPIVIKAVDPTRQITRLHLIVDRNPVPLAGVFRISKATGRWESLETRIRINEYTRVRAIGELDDGTLHMTSRFIKAAGGCSAPAMADLDAAMKRAGKMKNLLIVNNNGGMSSTEAVIRISHPNNSGMQFDQISRNYIPAFFIKTIAAELDGKPLINVETNFSMSENPMVRLGFTPYSEIAQSAEAMQVYAVDSRGNRYDQSIEVANKLPLSQQ
ncbi:MAG: quinoprotein dehydrogenase-associated SoxYZ-like carrier [Gammaproteobacteria bacterium]|nr:quinoprotein dehydrogenase-associated SoxYZ-like carrier [Gammaproteobacteria bacterium]